MASTSSRAASSSASASAAASPISRVHPALAPSAARATAFATALRSEAPCAMSATPSTPRSGAPPISRQSTRRRISSMAAFTSAPPSRAGSVRWSASFIIAESACAVPSIVFSATLPVKPSVTTTSTSPARRSRPSQ